MAGFLVAGFLVVAFLVAGFFAAAFFAAGFLAGAFFAAAFLGGGPFLRRGFFALFLGRSLCRAGVDQFVGLCCFDILRFDCCRDGCICRYL